jgi:NAD(P)-dependent dehydrogenase (short-subunit alcohol dehydrogenase family)
VSGLERSMAGAPELDKKVAIVTGGARGIGRATAVGLARAGADVAVLDRDAEEAVKVCQEIQAMGRLAHPVNIDLGELEQIAPAVASIVDRLGRVDILVNCAGVEGGPGTVLDLPLETWERTHRVDLTAPFLLIQHCARAMIAGGRGGRIVNVTSSSAYRAAMTQVDYASAKAALVGLTRSAAGDLAKHDINVNCVAPGMTVTSMTARVGVDDLQRMVEQGALENLFHRLSMPEDVAAAIVFLCLPASRQITAQTIHTSAGAVVS